MPKTLLRRITDALFSWWQAYKYHVVCTFVILLLMFAYVLWDYNANMANGFYDNKIESRYLQQTE